jgi:hypothetical protein
LTYGVSGTLGPWVGSVCDVLGKSTHFDDPSLTSIGVDILDLERYVGK